MFKFEGVGMVESCSMFENQYFLRVKPTSAALSVAQQQNGERAGALVAKIDAKLAAGLSIGDGVSIKGEFIVTEKDPKPVDPRFAQPYGQQQRKRPYTNYGFIFTEVKVTKKAGVLAASAAAN